VPTNLFVTAAAMALGYLVLGSAAERLQRRGINLTLVTGVGVALFLGVQLLICLGTTSAPMVLWAVFGCSGAASILPFAILSQAFPSYLAGRINTALNLLVFIGAFAGQYGIGAVINLWPLTATAGYALPAYQTAFGLLLGLEALAFAWFLRPVRTIP
jgi:hypothetical protein